MTQPKWQFLEGCARTTLEVRFYFKLHPCPHCGVRNVGEYKTDWYIRIFEDGSEHSAGRYDIVCPQCRHDRITEFRIDEDGGKRHDKFMDDVAKRCGYNLLDPNAWPVPTDVRRANRHLGAPPEPSTLIQPHEFAAEIVRLEAQRPVDRGLVDIAAWHQATDDGDDALTCVYELRKFFPDDAEEMPDEYVRTDGARTIRQAHPEWFRRSWIEAQVVLWEQLDSTVIAEADFRRTLPAADPRSYHHKRDERPPILPPLSPASILLHDKWLDDQDGERLHAKGIDATGKKLSALDLSAVVFENVVLDRADLSFTRLHGAKLTGVRARGASLASAMIAGTELTGCDFAGAAMPIANLGDAEIVDCDFTGADLERTTWYRSKVTRCKFSRTALTNGGFDKAVFTDCDFRGANLGLVAEDLLGTAWDATFVRCDLRDTNWQGLDLFRARFVDCKLAGAHGTPRLSGTVVEQADLSPDGDGSRLGGLREVCPLWGLDPDAPPPTPTPPSHRALTYELPSGEGDALEDELRRLGHHVATQIVRHGTELWVKLLINEPVAAPISPQIEAFLAAYRRAKPDTEPHRNAASSPPSVPAHTIVDAGIDRGAPFEEVVAELMDAGLTREQALEAVINPDLATQGSGGAGRGQP